MMPASDTVSYDLNPYESFIRKHLQHYGYFTANKKDVTIGEEAEGDIDAKSEEDLSDSDVEVAEDALDKDSTLIGVQDGGTREESLHSTQIVYSCEDGRLVAHLREPRQLFGFYTSLYGPLQPARWPSGLQVLVDRIRHIGWTSEDVEPLYRSTGSEATPLAISHEGQGRVVYNYEPLIGSYFVRSGLRSNLSRCTQVGVTLESDEDTTLLFESRFESGNLAKAVQVGPYEYELWLRYDLYTDRHMQWFYFRITNTRENTIYRFTIVNFMKSDSLYNCGMRPLVYSEHLAADRGIGWFRTGSNIKYYKNNITYASGKCERCHYSLTWTSTFMHDRDTVYFAHCYPYTYSDLQEYLGGILNDPEKSQFCRLRLLCRSLGDNSVYSITITSPSNNAQESKRKAVILTARVHPGESNSSWMMKGFLDFLLGDSSEAKMLRDNFLFRIIPMLNPDGVIVGNYRCSLAGRDLNRIYKAPIKELFPCIWHTRAMIKRLMDDRDVVLYCDLHGHSRKQNMFIYGCENRNNAQRRLQEQVFPYMLARNAPDIFSFSSSKFHIQKNKEGTGRVVMWSMGIMNSYTLEATFCGSGLGKKKGFHFNTKDYESLGHHFCDTLIEYCDVDDSKAKSILVELEEKIKAEILVRLKQLNDDISKTIEDIDLNKHYMSEIESSDGGSDSSISDGPPVGIQYLGSKSNKKKKHKSRKERDRKKSSSAEISKDKKPAPTNPVDQSERKSEIAAKPAKVVLPIKSMQFIYTRGQINSDKSSGDVPRFLQERSEDGNAKRVNGRYLEALTEACINEGIRCRNKAFPDMSVVRCSEDSKQRLSAYTQKAVSSQPPPLLPRPTPQSAIQLNTGTSQKFILPDDMGTESIVVRRPQSVFYSAAAVRNRTSFQAHSLKILDRHVQLERAPTRLSNERNSAEKSQKEYRQTQSELRAALGNSLPSYQQLSANDTVENARKLMSLICSPSEEANSFTSKPKMSSPATAQLITGDQALTRYKASSMTTANQAHVTNNEIETYLPEASDFPGVGFLLPTASRRFSNRSALPAARFSSGSVNSQSSCALRDDDRLYEDPSATDLSLTLSVRNANLRQKDRHLHSPSQQLYDPRSFPSKDGAADMSGIRRSKTCEDGYFGSGVNCGSQSQEISGLVSSKQTVSKSRRISLAAVNEAVICSDAEGCPSAYASHRISLLRSLNRRQSLKKKTK